jgi:ATP-dependent exoDNAse (exonuclease V) beta subunit
VNDQKQRDQALNISDSFIVQAPAGSGKTELITQRYLKLLGSADVPENILVMTFTNRAVDELKHRIISSLNRAKLPPPKELHKLKTFDLANKVLEQSNLKEWDLLSHPSRIKILTIDSLSSLIVSRYPSIDQLISPQTMINTYEYEQIYQEAAENTLLLIEEDEYQASISSVLLYLDNHVDRFYRLIVQMLSKREQWLPKLYIEGALDINLLEMLAQELIVEYLGTLRDAASGLLGKPFFNLLEINTRDDVSKINKLPGSTIEDLSDWQTISELLLTKSTGNWRKKIDANIGFPVELKEEKFVFKEILEGLDSEVEFKKILNNLSNLPSAYFPESTSKNINDIAQVLKLSVAELKMIFKEKSLQDFSEVGMQAINALDSREEVSDIALLLDYQVKHLLIDEFQDTSYSQLSLIEKLVDSWQEGDGKSIFFVGDPMQSIYKFRESQVGIFLEVMKNGIGNLKIKSLILSSNFRSNKSIVEKNNKIFSQIFPNQDNLLLGAIHYSESKSASQVGQNDAVTFYPFSADQDFEEAEMVVSIIKNSISTNPNHEVAVLVRSRSHLNAITLLLQESNINFEALKTEPLRTNLFTRDLLSLTRALLSLADRLAWLSILRAPWCGLNLKDLLAFSDSIDKTIFSQLIDDDIVKDLSADGAVRSRHLFLAIEEAIYCEGKFSFVERFSYALSQLCNEIELSEQEKSIRSQFLSLLNHCELNQGLDIKTIEMMVKDLFAPSKSAPIKLMTIHQAKGLEFDTVIIPGLGKKGKSDSLALMQIQEFSNKNILLAPIKSSYEDSESKTYLYLQYLQKQQTHFELMRVLYVAMSRAKDKIHLLGGVSKTGKAVSGSLLSFLSHYFQKSIDDIPIQDTSIPVEASLPKLQRNKSLSTVSNRGGGDITQSKNLPSNVDLIYQSALGSIVHYFLEHSLFEPSFESIDARFREFGLPPKLIHSYSKTASLLLLNTKRDKDFEWLFKYRDSTEVEAEYSSSTKTVIIDRLFIEDDSLWIIDFKTASLNEGESMDSFIERQKLSHQKQIKTYQEVLEDFFKIPSKIALYCPAVSKLILL